MKTSITSIIITSCLLWVGTAPVTVHAGIETLPPCSIFVDNTTDSGPGSLRDAILCANPGDTITFDTNGVFSVPQTIVLLTGELVVGKNLTIRGPGANRVTISGNHASRVFHIGQAPGLAIPEPAVVAVTTVTISGVTITNGFHPNSGGGIYNDHSTLTISNCVFAGNSVTSGGGGALYNAGQGFGSATMTVINSTLSSNTANEAAAIMNNGAAGSAALTLINSTLDGNRAIGFVGTIWNDGEQSGNGTLTIFNCTFSGNSAGLFANGILNDAANSGTATLDIGSTILDAGNSGNITNSGGTVNSHGYNLSSDNGNGLLTATGDQTNTPAQLGPLQNNGGPTPTRAPLCSSPAIDAGTNFLGLATDQRGFARTVGGATDIGAVELAGQTYTVSNTTDFGPGSLRQAILDANAHAGDDEIVFDPGVTGTITLTNGELLITDCLFLDGPGATNVAVNGNFPNTTNRVFHIVPGIDVTIAGLTITNGLATGNFLSGLGGGIFNDHSTLTVSNCTISGNSAETGGGIGISGTDGSATLEIVNNTLSGNSADTGGGAIASSEVNGRTTLEIVNSTFSTNSAFQGGAIFLFDANSGTGTVTVANSTFSGNVASEGTGFLLDASFSGTTILNLGSTILNHCTIVSFSGTVISRGYNLSSDNGSGFLTATGDQTNTPPLLGPLQLNGGQTPTHALLSGSPAIDAGTNFTDSATDQRGDGFSRTVGAATDIGAFEVQTLANQPPVAHCTNITVSADADCMATVNVSDVDNGSNDPDSGDSITLSFDASSVVTSTNLSGTGDHSVTLYVTDTHGAQSNCTATVTVKDTTPPSIMCPSNQVANATMPSGAVVNYPAAVASDNCGVISSLTYSKNSGTAFPIGTTTVTSRAIDDSSNTNSCTFTVKVKSASEQITDLMALVNGLSGVKPATKNALIVKLNAAQKALSAGNTTLACSNLKDFISLASAQAAKKQLTAAQANLLIAEATRIRAVLACP